MQVAYTELIDALFSDVNPIPIKTAMNLMGMEVGPLRMPLCEMADDSQLKAALTRKGLL
jgi:4-hydroxy-tetrahydrodipicolinate synthase